ncbi:serine hydroxymethyltransferase [Patescibacteria group bacterium]|nr:serine hydroxymethyltransferase [Patescibacteria group bacterium]MBU1500659.1 serine hydroxymethyltransferase [Patescibacteria group bacterium]MBU2080388.1 serine hydroxymethyltransferase [Patescibacteria group bacterium]MBU2124200.1 serine hydroxymethyltransferase [Patescibacteria group bacterium]MBU2194349.1 serine hydroxymethyltransferase [Patescibacteria group bacterium]
MDSYTHLKEEDRALYDMIEGEEKREKEGLELIPSENYVSQAVREAMGSVLTNKYSEGYPGKRYYGGQEYTDQVETLAIERAKALFNCDHANVQPLGGAAANIAAYFSWLEPGDAILGMDLSHGGHLTHGSPVTYMSKLYRFVRYGMKDIETGEIDYDEMLEVAKRERPKIVLAGFSGYPRELNWERIAQIAREVDAVAMADVAHIAGLIAGGAAKNPFDYGFNIVTTTTHKTLRGPRGGMILSKGMVSSPLRAPEKTIENLPTLIDRSVFPGFQGGPHMHQIAAKAASFKEAGTPAFKEYAQQVVTNARVMAEVFLEGGVRLITGGTDNHLILADVYGSLGISGGEAETLLDRAGITLNKNSIADDPRKPFDPSGIRFGTPAITTRGFKEAEVKRVAELMLSVLSKRDDTTVASAREEIRTLSLAHPVPTRFS